MSEPEAGQEAGTKTEVQPPAPQPPAPVVPVQPTMGQLLTEKFHALQSSMANRATASMAVEGAVEQVSTATAALANAKSAKSLADETLGSSTSALQSSITELVDQLTQYRDSLGS